MSKYERIVRQRPPDETPGQVPLTEELEAERVRLEAQGLEQSVQAMAEALAGPDRPGETYLEKVARLQTAQMTAQSDLTHEYLAAYRDPEDREVLNEKMEISDYEWRELLRESEIPFYEEERPFLSWREILEFEQGLIDRAGETCDPRVRECWEKHERPALEILIREDRSK